ncbi:MAG TPA: rhodanese-like domain-containing protein [Pyrinomonadaceae bacterium]|nr:rhodanese-like domain-containing protein [Pyrinomonadaceae bacterium]
MRLEGKFQIIAFYEFKALSSEELPSLRQLLRDAMDEDSIKGTIIIAEEGFNGTVCGEPPMLERFVTVAQKLLRTKLNFKASFHDECPFRKIDVKIKPEIVTLKKSVDISKGAGTHVDTARWNELISDPEVVVIDTRNDYEFKSGTFKRAINPRTEKFSDLPKFVEETLDPNVHQKVAMFCTGGIRCEKFAPYVKALGFKEVFQLDGGILRYLEQVPKEESLFDGECFVFDDRRTVDENLQKGTGPDYSQEGNNYVDADD